MQKRLLCLVLLFVMAAAAFAGCRGKDAPGAETSPPAGDGTGGAQDADPLLFMGEIPGENFHNWAKMRVRYDGRFTEKGVEGLVHVRFYIEPDGRITIGEVVQSPDERVTKEVLRAIRSSKGKWTPRKVRGVPQRTAYDYRGNYHNN